MAAEDRVVTATHAEKNHPGSFQSPPFLLLSLSFSLLQHFFPPKIIYCVLIFCLLFFTLFTRFVRNVSPLLFTSYKHL